MSAKRPNKKKRPVEHEPENLEEQLRADILAELEELLPMDPRQLPAEIQGLLQQALEGGLDLSELAVEFSEWADEEDEPSEPEDFYPLSSLETAERLYEAQWVQDLPDDEVRAVAREVLQSDPHSVDAHVLLGQLASDPAEQLREFERAVAVSRRWPQEEVQDAMPELRWTMAETLWEEGRRADAIEILTGALQDDPEDELHLRYALASWMLQLGWDDELGELLQQFADDQHTPWLFARALHQFRTKGPHSEAAVAIGQAHATNPHVAPLLLGHYPMPERVMPEVFPGTVEEAVVLVSQQLPAWRGTSGALPWLRDVLQLSEPGPLRRQTSSQRKQLAETAAELPACEETWQLTIVPWDADQTRTYLVTVSSGEDETERLLFEVCESRPGPSELWAMVCTAMAHPDDENPRRPRRLEVPTRSLAKTWKKRTERLGVECEFSQAAADATESRQLQAEIQQRLDSHRRQPLPTLDQLANLPRSEQVWSVSVVQPPLWIRDQATPRRPFLVLILDLQSGLVFANELLDAAPDTEQTLDAVARTMISPMVQEPHLPAELRVRGPDLAAAAAERFGDLGIPVIEATEHQAEDNVVEALTRQMVGQDEVPLIDTPGMTPENFASLYAAAAAFYKAAPWQYVPADAPIRIHCDAWSQTTWHAIVIGQLGQTLGISLYDSPEALAKSLRGGADAAERQSALFLHFGEAFEISPVDLLAIERHRWPIAAQEAYPLVGRVEPGLEFRPPEAEMLAVLDVALRTVPAFADRPTREPQSIVAKLPAGTFDVRLSWEGPERPLL